MFGRLPWLAFERRMRALRFLVFFDMGTKTIASPGCTGGQVQSLTHRARLSV